MRILFHYMIFDILSLSLSFSPSLSLSISLHLYAWRRRPTQHTQSTQDVRMNGESRLTAILVNFMVRVYSVYASGMCLCMRCDSILKEGVHVCVLACEAIIRVFVPYCMCVRAVCVRFVFFGLPLFYAVAAMLLRDCPTFRVHIKCAIKFDLFTFNIIWAYGRCNRFYG